MDKDLALGIIAKLSRAGLVRANKDLAGQARLVHQELIIRNYIIG